MRVLERLWPLVFCWSLAVGANGAEHPCSEAEQLGEVLPSEACLARVALEAAVAGAAVGCWLEIDDTLPPEDRLALRDECEAQAHWSVCGMARCY